MTTSEKTEEPGPEQYWPHGDLVPDFDPAGGGTVTGTAAQASPSDLEGLDEKHGYLCPDCRLIWVGGFDPQELGLDPDSDTLSDSARAFAESVRFFSCAETESSRYYDCMICDVVGVGGYETVAYMVP